MLFHLGIPVWLVHPVSTTPDPCIEAVGSLISKDTHQWIQLPSGWKVDVMDVEPYHPVIFEGLVNKPECYLAMAAYLYSLADAVPHVFGSVTPQNSNSMLKALSTTAPFYHLPASKLVLKNCGIPCMYISLSFFLEHTSSLRLPVCPPIGFV